MIVEHQVDEGDVEVNVDDVPAAGVAAEGVVSYDDDDAGISMNLLQNLMDICTTLTGRVDYLELDKITQALKITKLKQRVKKLERMNKLKVLKLRRLKRVGSAQTIDTSDDTVMDDVSKQRGIIANIDANKDVVLKDAKDVAVEKSADVKDNADIQGRKIITEVVTAASDTITAASTTIAAVDVLIPAATIAAALILTAAPMPNDEDDVYTEATPLAHKGPIVDYEIYNENKKPYYKIKRADGLHQLYLSFLRSVHGQAKVKSWKLLESCSVQIITFTTTQLILLVERRYPLTRFTLDQMLNNVRLKVEEESKVSLELLRFIRQQHQEGAQLEWCLNISSMKLKNKTKIKLVEQRRKLDV
nr:hypothetical protein [Tanacetum cinerariifolium]